MKKSILPAFIKRRSVGNIKEVTSDLEDILKEDDSRTIHLATGLEEQRFFRGGGGVKLNLDTGEGSNKDSLCVPNSTSQPGSPLINRALYTNNEIYHNATFRRHSSFGESVFENKVNIVISNHSAVTEDTKGQMVEQEDIIALTKHVRSFSDALNNLRNTFKESTLNGVYDEAECKSVAHNRLSEVLKILKEILGKYPPLHSSDILTAASAIIKKIKTYNYADGKDGPLEYNNAIDQLALSFSSSVHDFLLGDKDMASPNSPGSALDQDEEGSMYHEEDDDAKFFQREDDEKNESEDSLERSNSYDIEKAEVEDGHSSPLLQRKVSNLKDLTIQRTDQLDKTLLSIEGSVEIALQRTKVWAKYAKEILNYFERRSHLEAECSKQIANMAQKTKTSIMEESYLPFQSIFVTALENDGVFANSYSKSCQSTLQHIVDKLNARMKDHDAKRAKIKSRWKNEMKKLNESRDNLRTSKKLYMQKHKELEKFNKQQLEGKDEKGGFSIGKKKGQEDFQKSAEDSENQYKQCVEDANFRQQELERIKSESLIELRQLVYQCDTTMKIITIDYFKMMNSLYNPLPVQYRALADSCKNYEEGQQFADFVKLQQSTSNQAMCPTYHFEPYRGEGSEKFNSSMRQGADGNLLSISSEDYLSSTPNALPRRPSINFDQNDRPKQAWGSLPRNKGSATDDTDSLSSRSLPGSPQTSPPPSRKKPDTEFCSDDESTFKEAILKGQKAPQTFKNQKLSAAAKTHKFRQIRSAAKCKECDSYAYFNGNECERCGLICHKKCLEKLAIKCGNKRLPRKMTTFGVDFHQHLAATKRKDIPYIIEKCIETIDDKGLDVKGLYRVSGVKSKVEKLCQQFETGGDLVDLSTAPPHFVASVLKLYLRQLPEPLLTFKLYRSFIDIAKDSMNLNLKTPADIEEMNDHDANLYEEIIEKLHQTVKSLPSANFYTTAKLIKHLKRVAEHEEENQMSAANIAIVFGPTLLKPEGDPSSLSTVMDMSHQTRAVELLILNSQIFSVVEDVNGTEVGRKPSTPGKKKTQTVLESPGEKEENNISRDFTKEVLFIVEASQKRTEEEKTAVDTQAVLPGQTINDDYDNLRDDFETDVATNLPVIQDKANKISTQSSVVSDSTEYDSTLSRLSSIDSILSDAISFDPQSPIELPDSSQIPGEEQDDDLWMNQFGKEPLSKTLSSSAVDTIPVSASTFDMPIKKKKTSSQSRLETTTYSFSIGNFHNNQISEDEPLLAVSDDPNVSIDIEPSSWAKQRDSKDRVPVRKHLKTVNVKATVSVEDETKTTATDHEKNNEELLNGDNNLPPASEQENNELSINVNISRQQLNGGSTEHELPNTPKSPSKQGPTVLPKPKKPLDKKSWTANLIKSKTQKIPEQPQYGSLNEKLLHGNKKTDDTTTNQVIPRTSSLSEKPSVREIRERFQHAEESSNNNLTPASTVEKYV